MSDRGPWRPYSKRVGSRAGVPLDLDELKDLFRAMYVWFDDMGYLEEAVGRYTAAGYVPGFLGRDLEEGVFRYAGRRGLAPVLDTVDAYSEEDLFDAIELLHKLVSKPDSETKVIEEGTFGPWSYFVDYDHQAGSAEFREQMNAMLADYGPGYELTPAGELVELGDDGFRELLSASYPAWVDQEKVVQRVEEAKRRFRRHHTSLEDRRSAILALAEALEHLRPKVRQVLTRKDESDLFNILNNFEIRHNNERQQRDYDKDIWHRWMFYFYLATIHAVLRLVDKAMAGQVGQEQG